MRLPLAVLPFLPLPLAAALEHPQSPFAFPPAQQPPPPCEPSNPAAATQPPPAPTPTQRTAPTIYSTTLIDALSDGNYTLLLTLLQHARLVPTLNRLNGSTLFAPTNDAIQKHALTNPLWARVIASPPGHPHPHPLPTSSEHTEHARTHTPSRPALADNVRQRLRQQLLYHVLNYSVFVPPGGQDPVQVHRTLHFPRADDVGAPRARGAPDADAGADVVAGEPWVPSPGGGALCGEPQRLRWAAREGGTWVGTDYKGEGGVRVEKDAVNATNGVLLGIGGVLDPPRDLADVVAREGELGYFDKIMSERVKAGLNRSEGLTLFMPQDGAWEELHEVERLYLESRFADDDVQKIVDMHTVRGVRWSDTFADGKQLTTAHGDNLTLHVSPDAPTNVSWATVGRQDEYAANGVLHVVSSLLIPSDALQLTPEKYLLALNCTTFVELLRSVQLSALVNTTNASYTILAPRDDVLALLGDPPLPDRGSAELARVLRYHFLPGQWTEEQLRDGMLVETALEERGLGGGRQVLDVTVTGSGAGRELTFGGAAVIGGKPLIINDTIIYLITRALIPPADALQTALPTLRFSMFLAAVFSSGLANKLKTASNTTLLIPPNDAFERLGLVTTHLLLPSSKQDLEQTIEHHALREVAYLAALHNGSRKSYPTLAGSDVHIERRANGSVVVLPSGGWQGLRGMLGAGNVLTRTGVVHEVASVLLPRSIDVSVAKLAAAARGSIMASLAARAGMEWVLNGTAPPAGSEWGGMSAAGWTLLCPTDDAFKGVNMTQLWNDPDAMQRLVAQHLIPAPAPARTNPATLAASADPNRPLFFDGRATYSTLLSRTSFYGDVVFRHADRANPALGYVVGIKDARGTDGSDDWAHVLAWGRSTSGAAVDVGGVVQIDHLLVPYLPAWWVAYGPPAAVLLAGVLVMAVFFGLVRWVWRRETGEATYEPVGGFDRDDDD